MPFVRVSNIYDLGPRIVLFKFLQPEAKHFLLIESGIRIHTTEFWREKNKIPSGFALKVSDCLSKEIKSQKVLVFLKK